MALQQFFHVWMNFTRRPLEGSSALKDRDGNKSSSVCFLKQKRKITVASLINISEDPIKNECFFKIC